MGNVVGHNAGGAILVEPGSGNVVDSNTLV